MTSLILILALCYLVGSIPSSVWAGRALYGVDVREHGSENAGATNAFRVLGWKVGVLSSVGDFGKGMLAAGLLATIRIDPIPAFVSFGFGWETQTVLQLLAGLAAIVGHMFPIWAQFRGGKGVNTSAGVLFAITPVTMLLTLSIFAVVLFSTRYVSLASITGAISFPSIVAVRRYLFDIDALDPSLLITGALLAIAIVIAHRSNIKRLLQGNENRIRSFRPASGRLDT